MDFLYKTVGQSARAEITIERSRFISSVMPCETRACAEAFFDEIRKEFKDATHNVPAFVVGKKMELKYASDDGEPQGTAGPPILRYLEMNELTNLAVVVTRYFGGIKLGTGGLVRAYTEGVDSCVKAAGIAGALEKWCSKCNMDYSAYNKLLAYKFPQEIGETLEFGNPGFSDNVTLDISVAKGKEELLKGILRDISLGKIEIKGEEILIKSISLTSMT